MTRDVTGEPANDCNDDRMVGERLRAALALIEAPLPDLEWVVARARRRRVWRVAAALAVAAVVLAGGVALPLTVLAPGGTDQRRSVTPPPASTTGPQPATTRPAALPAPRPGWVWHRDPADRLAIQTPAAWHFSPDVGVGLVRPTALFIAGTGPLPAGGDCAPTRAIKALPHDGALFWVIEYADTVGGQSFNPYEFPPRPDRLDLGPLVGPKECIGERTHQLLFREAGRFFQVEVLFGPAAPRSLRAAAVASLQSLRPEPAAVSLAEQCQRQWVFCPEAAWVFRVLNQAGLFHWGSTGSAIQAGPQDPQLDPGRKVDLWTTRGGALPSPGLHQVAVVDGIAVYGDGTRLLWRVQGLNVWVQAEQQRSALPRGAMLAKLVRASRAVMLVPDNQ
jgi:hypothetical protein